MVLAHSRAAHTEINENKEMVEIINRAKEEAKTEANNILSQAQEAIKNEKRLAINELKGQVSSLALDIAEKVLQNELESKEKQIELVDNLLKNSDLK